METPRQPVMSDAAGITRMAALVVACFATWEALFRVDSRLGVRGALATAAVVLVQRWVPVLRYAAVGVVLGVAAFVGFIVAVFPAGPPMD